jgi:hypothetical protein
MPEWVKQTIDAFNALPVACSRICSVLPPSGHIPALAHVRARQHLISERLAERIRHGTTLKKGYEAARTSANSKVAGNNEIAVEAAHAHSSLGILLKRHN